jgi:hypothetical protein
MYTDHTVYALQDREIREQELFERMAESRRRALGTSRGLSLRARIARRLFALVAVADRQEA